MMRVKSHSQFTGLALLLTTIVVEACGLPTVPLPPNATILSAPSIYSRWWGMTEACSGRSGNFESINWYTDPGALNLNGESVDGYWDRNANRIVLADGAVDRGSTVRHEMLHALLGTGKHPRSEFLGNCAFLVDCQATCVTDAGHWQLPQTDYRTVPPESLIVKSAAELLPAEADGQRWFTLEVTVANARNTAVLVAAPGGSATPQTFGFDLRGSSGGLSGADVAGDSSAIFFQPFEIKKRLFEFRVTSDLTDDHISPGDYLARGSYGRTQSVFQSIRVDK